MRRGRLRAVPAKDSERGRPSRLLKPLADAAGVLATPGMVPLLVEVGRRPATIAEACRHLHVDRTAFRRAQKRLERLGVLRVDAAGACWAGKRLRVEQTAARLSLRINAGHGMAIEVCWPREAEGKPDPSLP